MCFPLRVPVGLGAEEGIGVYYASSYVPLLPRTPREASSTLGAVERSGLCEGREVLRDDLCEE